jgi:peptidoglycan biosynthesis protein MviN/MurJ (putative lipid II flippase)
MIIGQILMSLVTIIDQFYLTHLSEGSISTLNYANRILGLILSMGAIAITRATLPVFSKRQFNNQLDQLYLICLYWTKLFFVLGFLASAAIWPISDDLVRFIFERGAFNSSNTVEVSEILKYLLLQVPLYFAGIVLVSLLASRKKYKIIALSGLINLITKIAGNYFLIPILGVNGVACSTVIMYLFALIFLAFNVRKEFSNKIAST